VEAVFLKKEFSIIEAPRARVQARRPSGDFDAGVIFFKVRSQTRVVTPWVVQKFAGEYQAGFKSFQVGIIFRF
jgi:hypothetical protein